jgi:hypothetical protein
VAVVAGGDESSEALPVALPATSKRVYQHLLVMVQHLQCLGSGLNKQRLGEWSKQATFGRVVQTNNIGFKVIFSGSRYVWAGAPYQWNWLYLLRS